MMKARITLIAITALALTAGCNRGATNNSANKSTTNTTAAAPAAPAAGQPVDTAFLTANPWAPEGRCAEALTFNPDGTAMSRGEQGNWTLAGNMLTLTKSGEPDQQIQVARAGTNLSMAIQGGSVVAMPCPAGSGAAAAANEADAAEDKE